MGIKSKIIGGLVMAPLAVSLLLGQAIAQQIPEGTKLEETVQQSDIFNYGNLTDVDLSRKTVKVDVYLDSFNSLQRYQEDRDAILKKVVEFYKSMDVDLDIRLVDKIDYSSLKPTEHIAIELLSESSWKNRNYEIIIQENYLGLKDPLSTGERYAAELTENADGTTYLKKSIALIFIPSEPKHFKDAPRLIIHEIGHLFGLYHSDEFVDDPIPSFLDSEIINFMEHGNYPRYGFNEFQKRIIHSFLSEGLVNQQLKAVNFDPTLYKKRIKEANNYHYRDEK